MLKKTTAILFLLVMLLTGCQNTTGLPVAINLVADNSITDNPVAVKSLEKNSDSNITVPICRLDFDTQSLNRYEWDLNSSELINANEIVAVNVNMLSDIGWNGSHYLVTSDLDVEAEQSIDLITRGFNAPCYRDFILVDYSFDTVTDSMFVISNKTKEYAFDFSHVEIQGFDVNTFVVSSFFLQDNCCYFLLCPLLVNIVPKVLVVVKANLDNDSYEVFQVDGDISWVNPTPPIGKLIFSTNDSFIFSDGSRAVYEISYNNNFNAKKVFDLDKADFTGTGTYRISSIGYHEQYLLIHVINGASDTLDSYYYAVSGGRIVSSLKEESDFFFLPNL
jgi:hypothetical protein